MERPRSHDRQSLRRWGSRAVASSECIALQPSERYQGPENRHLGWLKSREQHRKSRPLVLIASTNSQLAADLFDKRADDPQSESPAGD